MENFTFTSRDGLQLAASFQKTEFTPYVVAIVHGMGEHKGRYAHVADFFLHSGYSVALFDQRGHGNSGGKRGHTPSLDAMLNDVDDFLAEVRKRMPGQKIVLYGHSMGANIVLNYTLRRKPDIAAVVGSSPYLRLAFEPPAFKLFLARTVGKLLPELQQKTGLEVTAISRDARVVEAYKNDPLVHEFITSSFFNSVHFAGVYPIEHAAEFQVPCLLFHGTEDRLTSYKATVECAENAKGKVELKLWNGLYHECHNEPEQHEVLSYVNNWLKNTLK
ncbi:MAG: alpha/beta hydrolase [Bacteroidia bacterium]|nr:alpha/beta hydrolase [Bacteroidia bacterium]